MANDDIKSLLEQFRHETLRRMAELQAAQVETRQVLEGRIESVRQELKAENAETRRELHIVREHLEARDDLIIEAITAGNEKLAREDADIRREMRQGFADTKAILKYSYSELDRRVTALEDK